MAFKAVFDVFLWRYLYLSLHFLEKNVATRQILVIFQVGIVQQVNLNGFFWN